MPKQRHVGWAVGLAALCSAPSPSMAQSAADQRWHIDDILSRKDARSVQSQRAQCAVGHAEAMIANMRRLGAETLPDAAAWCIASLIRVGRDGGLTYVRDATNATLTPALAFDNGFVTGFSQRKKVPADAPAMALLQPVAQRCLGQREANTALCNAAGYAVGARAARGELPIIN